MPGMRVFEVKPSAGLMVTALLAACSAQAPMPMADTPAEGAAPIQVADDTHPVVVELFQSQGCSSCPPANANLNRVAGDKGVLALSFAVTYWDQLGWKDRFARPEFTKRQWDYTNTARRERVYTPQVIVNGKAMMLGGDKAHFARLIDDAGPITGGPRIDRMGPTLVVGPGMASTPASVWLVRYDPRERAVAIRAGENGGRTLPHRNIVSELRELGRWSGQEARFAVPPAAGPGLRTAVLVQRGTGGPIIAARKL